MEWWYVNLACRPDRREHAEKQFARYGIPAHRFEAFTPDQWDGKPEDVERMKNRTPGAIGCWHSQQSIIEKFIDTDYVGVVCEDDIFFCDDLHKRLEYLNDHAPDDWDIIYLGATFHTPGEWYRHPDCASWAHLERDAEPTNDKHIMRVYGEWGTYCYLVNGRNARKVVNLLDEIRPVSDGIDHAFIRLGDRVNAYCFVPGCVIQYDNQSNIGKGITEFSHFATLGPYWFTKYMEDFDPATYNWE
jgi:GR25 family glycosyltransferase involved in LPS biosynthesis